VKNVRRKIEPNPREPRHVLTVYGVGYRVAEPAD
jgi:two-component system alkaline phosphatase synthesis response regulator PhoP